MIQSLCGLVLMTLTVAVAARQADDLATLKQEDVQTAVKEYVKASPAAPTVKAVEALSPLIDVSKVKVGTGISYKYDPAAKTGKFGWEYTPTKEKLDNAEKVSIEKGLRGLLADTLKERKADLKLDEMPLEEAITLANAATVQAANTGGAAGVTGGLVGELELAKFDVAQLRASVKAHLAAKPDAVQELKELVYLQPVLIGEGASIEGGADAPALAWKYSPKKKSKLTPEEQDKVAKALRTVLTAALSTEQDKAKKLRPTDLTAVLKVAEKATVEPLPYSNLFDITSATFQEWVTTYIEATPTALDLIKSLVDVKRNLEALNYIGWPDQRLEWQYSPVSGRSLSAQEREEVGAALKALLRAATEAGAARAEYSDADKAELSRIIDTGFYTPLTKDGIRKIEDVSQDKIQEMLTRQLKRTRADVRKLQDLGISVATDADRQQLVTRLAYEGPSPVKFVWKYRLSDPTRTLSEADVTKIETGLREVLASAVESGGGNVELKPTGFLYSSKLKGPIDTAKIEVIKEFTTKDLTAAIVREIVEQKVLGKSREVRDLEPLIDIRALYSAEVLGFNTEKLDFSLPRVPLAKSRKDSLTPEEVATVRRLVKALLKRSFAEVTKKEWQLIGDELTKINLKIDEATIEVLNKELSEQSLQLIEQNRRLAADQQAQADRLSALEDEVAELRRSVQTIAQGQAPAGPKCVVQYVEQRGGVLGHKRVMVPVVVQVP